MLFTLRRVRLNQGGYDDQGRYWGVGEPLYHYSADIPDTFQHLFFTDSDRCGQEPSVPGQCEYCGKAVVRVTNDITDYLRAHDRNEAKAVIARRHPGAKFYR